MSTTRNRTEPVSSREKVFEVLADAQMTETEVAVAAGLSLSETVEALDALQDESRARAVLENDGLIVWSRA